MASEVYSRAEGAEAAWQPYVVVPAEFLSSYGTQHVRQPEPIPNNDKECHARDRKFFQFTSQESTQQIPGAPFSGSHPSSFEKHSHFTKGDFDPLANIVDSSAVAEILLEFFQEEKDEMAIQSPLIDSQGSPFQKANYWTNVTAFY